MKQKLFRLCLIFLVLVIWFGQIPAAASEPVHRRVCSEGKKIALTFDDGPHPVLTPKILAILKKYQIRATFFMIGKEVEWYADTARAVAEDGHEIGNHSDTHSRLSSLPAEKQRREVERCQKKIEKICGIRPVLFRPPEGIATSAVGQILDRENYTLVLWSIDTRDWECKNAEKIAARVLKQVQPGDIILMHDYIGHQSQTPEALEIILPKLLAQGYEFVTVSELLAAL